MEKLYTINEASEHLIIHRNTVLNMIKDGRIKAVKIGTKYAIAESEVERLRGGEDSDKFDMFGRQQKFKGNKGSLFFMGGKKCSLPLRPIKGDTMLFYETVGRYTSWHVNCTCCGEAISNSTEIDVFIWSVGGGHSEEVRMNACHYCSNTHIYPTLETIEVLKGDPKPKELVDFIISSFKGK